MPAPQITTLDDEWDIATSSHAAHRGPENYPHDIRTSDRTAAAGSAKAARGPRAGHARGGCAQRSNDSIAVRDGAAETTTISFPRAPRSRGGDARSRLRQCRPVG